MTYNTIAPICGATSLIACVLMLAAGLKDSLAFGYVACLLSTSALIVLVVARKLLP